MKIEGVIRPQIQQIIIDALQNDPFFTDDRLHAGKQTIISLLCAKKMPTSVTVIDLASLDHPDLPHLTTGLLAIGEKTHVIFKRADTTGQKTVAENTLSSFCSQVNCALNGCALLKEKQAFSDIRKRPNNTRRNM
jgi:hypothetical protein